MFLKIHNAHRIIVSLADSNLIGKKFSEGNKQIEVRQNFYVGEEKELNEIITILKEMEKEDATFNFVGKESINAGLKAGVIKKEGFLYIDGIPIALGLF